MFLLLSLPSECDGDFFFFFSWGTPWVSGAGLFTGLDVFSDFVSLGGFVVLEGSVRTESFELSFGTGFFVEEVSLGSFFTNFFSGTSFEELRSF